MCRAAQVLVPITAGSEPVEAFVPIAVLRRAGADVTVAAAGAGAGAGLRVHAMYGVTVVADASVADCADASYDLVALPVRTRRLQQQLFSLAKDSVAHAHAHDAGRCSRRGQPRRLRGAGEHREASRARGRALCRHLRRAAAGAGALGPAQRRQGDPPACLVIRAAPTYTTCNTCVRIENVLCSDFRFAFVQATAHPAFVDKFPAEVSAVDANVVVNGRVVTGRGPAPAMEFALALVEQLYGKDKVDEIAKPMVREHETRLTINRRNKRTRPKKKSFSSLIVTDYKEKDLHRLFQLSVQTLSYGFFLFFLPEKEKRKTMSSSVFQLWT
jgi:putative intracellular protease/amidase